MTIMVAKADTNEDTRANCSPDVWAQLVRLYEQRSTEKAAEQDLIRTRKVLEEDLAAAQKGSKKYTQLCVEYWETRCQIETARAHIKAIADQMESTIKGGMQGVLFECGPLDAEVTKRSEPLFDKEDDDGDDADVSATPTKPIGRVLPTWGNIPVYQLPNVPETVVKKLVDAGFTTFDDVAQALENRTLRKKSALTENNESLCRQAIALQVQYAECNNVGACPDDWEPPKPAGKGKSKAKA